MKATTLNQASARVESVSPATARCWFGVLECAWQVVATTLIPVSLIWDFSWESTVGVDRFWSPPHVTTHVGVWLSVLLGVRLIVVATMAQRQGGAVPGVNVLGWHGPAGAWVLLWGGGVMLAAYLLDAWWQKAYGLGAGIWSPPQLLKTVGFFALLIGGVMLGIAARHSGGLATKETIFLSLWQSGLVVAMAAIVLSTRNYPNWQHGATFHVISSAVYPALLLLGGRATRLRWGATGVALAYMILWSGLVWILPLFPAQPLMAPIHNPMEHLLPPPFPLLLVGPALALDLISMRLDSWRTGWRRLTHVVLLGVAFVSVFIPTQWFFAEFLLSAAADNWFFAGGGRHWPFFIKIDAARTMFWDAKSNPVTGTTILLAGGLAMGSAGVGYGVGGWLNRLRR